MPQHTPLHRAAIDAVASCTGVSPDALKVDTPPRPELGDLAVGCFAAAKAAGKPPAEVARAVAAAFRPGELLASATAAGPFVNFRADRAASLRWLCGAALAGALLPRELGAGQTITIDYGSPNISKHLAYHHLRGTTIGHALAQTFRALGYHVVAINFLGDWGTTHGMVLAAYHKWGAPEPLTVEALNELYVRFRQEPDHEDQGRAWLRRLEDGDPEATALWQRFRAVSWAEFEDVYELLGIHYDDLNGESFFWRDTARIVDELRAKGLLVESEGAQVVELPGEKTPILLLTKDGTTLYATRDVAAAEYRWRTYHPTRSLYVVDRGQGLHFRQLYKLLARMGHDWASRCEHVSYGLVRVGGKKTGTRLGNVVLMRDVFAIAEDEVRVKIAEVNPGLPDELVAIVARQVGIGAVVFANLAQQREKDIDFDLDRAVSLDGDSGPYLQYSHARCASIFRKALAAPSADAEFARLGHDAEWAVARKLFDFADHVVRAAAACEPHVVCHYLLEVAGEFSRWYTAGNADPSLRVLCDDAATRKARLALVGATQAVLREGLSLLGIAAPDQM
ncbi:MAG TPA: arginine--tRNA ligase [Kofleriaceae bacterium]|nr:arginine--tRNA ligase [Kofleriaceae bacterium]